MANEFEKIALETKVKFEEYEKQLKDILSKMENLSEETGIPFPSEITPLAQSYYPDSFEAKWQEQVEKEAKNWLAENEPDLDEEDLEDELPNAISEYVSDITGAYTNDWDGSLGGGWQHSAVC